MGSENEVREWSVRLRCERKVGDLGERVGCESKVREWSMRVDERVR